MARERHAFTVDISAPALLGSDLRDSLNRLPDWVKVDMAQTVALVLGRRLVSIDGNNVAHPSPLFVAFAAFVDRLVDEVEAPQN